MLALVILQMEVAKIHWKDQMLKGLAQGKAAVRIWNQCEKHDLQQGFTVQNFRHPIISNNFIHKQVPISKTNSQRYTALRSTHFLRFNISLRPQFWTKGRSNFDREVPPLWREFYHMQLFAFSQLLMGFLIQQA